MFKTMPIMPGLMPIQSYKILLRTTKLSHARLPADILARLDVVKWISMGQDVVMAGRIKDTKE